MIIAQDRNFKQMTQNHPFRGRTPGTDKPMDIAAERFHKMMEDLNSQSNFFVMHNGKYSPILNFVKYGVLSPANDWVEKMPPLAYTWVEKGISGIATNIEMIGRNIAPIVTEAFVIHLMSVLDERGVRCRPNDHPLTLRYKCLYNILCRWDILSSRKSLLSSGVGLDAFMIDEAERRTRAELAAALKMMDAHWITQYSTIMYMTDCNYCAQIINSTIDMYLDMRGDNLGFIPVIGSNERRSQLPIIYSATRDGAIDCYGFHHACVDSPKFSWSTVHFISEEDIHLPDLFSAHLEDEVPFGESTDEYSMIIAKRLTEICHGLIDLLDGELKKQCRYWCSIQVTGISEIIYVMETHGIDDPAKKLYQIIEKAIDGLDNTTNPNLNLVVDAVHAVQFISMTKTNALYSLTVKVDPNDHSTISYIQDRFNMLTAGYYNTIKFIPADKQIEKENDV